MNTMTSEVIKGRSVLHSPMERRRFLLAAGAGTIASLAGCQTAVGAVAPPQVPTERLEAGGWTKQSEVTDETVFEEAFGPVTVEAKASSVAYEDTELAARVREDTLGAIDATLALFTATRIDLAPSVDELGPVQGEVRSRIEETAKEQLRAELRSAGLEDVEQTETGSLEVAGGAEANRTEFTATYPVQDIEFPVRADQTLTIEGGGLAVDALLAVWAANGYYLVAGGAYPAENYARTETEALSDAISVSVEVDLGLTPEAYREELLGLVTGVR